jgi:hypothetical protein
MASVQIVENDNALTVRSNSAVTLPMYLRRP